MKSITILLLIVLSLGCTNNQKNDKENKEEQKNTKIEKEVEKTKKEKKELKKYSTVGLMLKEEGEYSEDDGTLKIIKNDENFAKIQIAFKVFEGDQTKIIKEMGMREIVYVTFQSFAKTNVNEVTVISIPLKMKDNDTKDGYLNNYKKTISVKRKKAKELLKYSDANSFDELYKLKKFENGSSAYILSEKFNELQYEYLKKVYNNLKK